MKHTITEAELIARQAKRIEELKEEVTENNKALHDIKMKLVCIGGPLNDNYHQYNQAQRKIFYDILDLCE